MPRLVLLDATPLGGPGCDHADRVYVGGLIAARVDRPERVRWHRPVGVGEPVAA